MGRGYVLVHDNGRSLVGHACGVGELRALIFELLDSAQLVVKSKGTADFKVLSRNERAEKVADGS